MYLHTYFSRLDTHGQCLSPPCPPALRILETRHCRFHQPTNLRLLAVRCRIVHTLHLSFAELQSHPCPSTPSPQFAQFCKRLDRRLLRHGRPFFWKRSLCLASQGASRARLYPLPILEMLSCPALSLSLSLSPRFLLISSFSPGSASCLLSVLRPHSQSPLCVQGAALICPKCPEKDHARAHNMRYSGRGWWWCGYCFSPCSNSTCFNQRHSLCQSPFLFPPASRLSRRCASASAQSCAPAPPL
jgi:hypothetical protein